MSEKNQKYLAVIALIAVVGVIFFVKRKHAATKSQSPEQSVAAVDSKAGKAQSLSKGSAPRVTGPNTEAVVHRQQAMIEAGFTPTPLIVDGKGAHFNVHVKIKKTCNWGDLDLIRGELVANSGARLLLTLESLVPGDREFKPIAQPITFEKLAAGFDQSFDFPALKSPKSVGVFLCSDTGQGDSCANKKVEDINAAYKAVMAPRQLGDGKLSNAYKPPYRVYFFQHVLLASTAADVQVGTKFDDNGYKKITSVLAKELGSAGSAQTVAQRVRELNQKVTSIPVASTPTDLSLILSMKDQAAACPKVVSKPATQAPMPPKGVQPVRLPGERYYRMPPQVR
ncbi:MAG: hypothetical protein NTY08_18035 [Proteobacteria bacterium]|nr:hypothetical protein [Pseudomonadota bacterium]